jgi:hypothetical protein
LAGGIEKIVKAARVASDDDWDRAEPLRSDVAHLRTVFDNHQPAYAGLINRNNHDAAEALREKNFGLSVDAWRRLRDRVEGYRTWLETQLG